MAYKCKGCGYRFKPSDSDLCPECFTARDDIGCGSFGDGGSSHTHLKDNADGDDFIAKQLREEARLTRDEFSEEISTFTDGLRRSFGDETPPNTFQSTQPQRINYSGTAQQPAKKKNGLFTVMAILLISIPYIYIRGYRAVSDYRTSKIINKVKLEATADNFTFDKKIAGSEGVDNGYNGTLSIADPRLTEYIWYGIKCDISLSDSDYTVSSITITGFGGDETQFTWTTVNELYGSGSELRGVPLCVTPAGRYTLALECRDSSGEVQWITQKLVLSDELKEFEKQPYSSPIDEPLYHDYNYVPGYFYSSLTDETGSGIKLRMVETPHELVDNENVGSFIFEDESLSKSDMKLCKVELMLGGKPAVYNEVSEYCLAGLDANGVITYEYRMAGDPELPISSRVQYYELTMIVNDKDGFDRSLSYKFYSNDLYNTFGK